MRDIQFSRAGFTELGFVGWQRFGNLTEGELPPERGVYVVVLDTTRKPEFLHKSVGGPHKGRPLTASLTELESAWRDGAEVVYIGKAGGRAGLRDRVWAYAKQGRGRSAGHAGGRFIWQLPASDQLVVGWRTAPDRNVGELEEALLALHVEQFQRRPFANLKGGRRMSPPKARSLLAAAFAQSTTLVRRAEGVRALPTEPCGPPRPQLEADHG